LLEQKHSSGRFVLPGEQLGVIEEFMPESGTYVKDGIIHSKIVGYALIDFHDRKVSVYPRFHGARFPRVGSIVIGQVSNVQPQMATVRIFKVGKRPLSGFFTSMLHVSDVQLRFVESMFDVCRTGDIIRAEVISEKNRIYHLSTKGKSLGVVYAFCSNCGYMLEQKYRELYCARCGKVEKRKIAADYGRGII